MSKKGLQWTQKQKEIAELLRQGSDPQAVIEKLKVSKTLVSRVQKALAAEKKNPETPLKQPPPGPPGGQTLIRTRVTDSVEVGQIFIEPEDWRVNQYGGLMILGTYQHAKEKFDYAGTVGEFLCDCIQIIRKIFGLDMVAPDYLWREGENDGQTASEGVGVLAAGGEETDRGGGPEQLQN